MRLEVRPERSGAIQNRASWAICVFVPDGSPYINGVFVSELIVNTEHMLKVRNLEQPQSLIIPRAIVGHVRKWVEIQERLTDGVDSIRGNHVIREALARSRIDRLGCRLGEVARALKRGRLSVTCDIRCSHSKATPRVGKMIQRVVDGIKKEELLAIGIEGGNCERNRPA